MSRMLAMPMLVAIAFPGAAWSKDKPAPVKHIQVEVEKTDATQYQVDQYYVRLVAGIGDVAFPADKKLSRKRFDEILAALGGRRKSREVGVRLLVRTGGIALPEYPLATYKLTPDGAIVLTDVASYSFPRMRLNGGDKITVNVIFRDAQDVDYKLGDLGKNVVALLPGGSLVSDIAKPHFQQLTDVTSKLFSAVGSHSVSHDHQLEMGLAASDTKLVTLRLRTAAGDNFGLVSLRLMATPTLARDEVSVFDLQPEEDLKRPDGEDPSGQEFTVGTLTRPYLGELRALGPHAEMLKQRSDHSVKLYCIDARASLVRHGLTMMDRTYLMLHSLKDANFPLAQPSWFHACFNEAEKASLKLAHALDPGIAPTSTGLTHDQHYAFGCLVRRETGQKCEQKAPKPEEFLAAAMHDHVGFVIDSSYVDSTGWGADEGMAAKARLLSGLRHTATNFSCIRDESALLRNPSGKVFRLKGQRSVEGGRIVSLSILPVSESEWECIRH